MVIDIRGVIPVRNHGRWAEDDVFKPEVIHKPSKEYLTDMLRAYERLLEYWSDKRQIGMKSDKIDQSAAFVEHQAVHYLGMVVYFKTELDNLT